MSPWRRLPLHILFLAAYPILSLAATNTGQVHAEALARPLAFTLGLSFVLWLALSWLVRDRMKAGLLISFLLILFFSYGHVYEWLQRATLLDGGLGRHRYLLPLWLTLHVLVIVAFRRFRSALNLNYWLNSVGLVLILLPLVQLGSYGWRAVGAQQAASDRFDDPATGEEIRIEPPEVKPDVYYIVLDAYARSDVLAGSWGIDNSGFLSDLEQLGFKVANCSQSNYSQTELAFASALNLAYLEDLGDQFVANRDDRTALRPLIKQSLVRRLLEEQGYQTVAFETGYPFSELQGADVYVAPRFPGLSGGLSGFEALLLRSSAGLILLDASEALPRFLVPEVDHTVIQHRQRTVLALETLKDSEQFEGPTFIFAHIVSPHKPFIFGLEPGGLPAVSPTFDGPEDERQAWYRQGYADQVEYLNDQLLAIISKILAESETPPVIILQGDHGPEEGSSQDRMRILNAYYLAGAGAPSLYEEITPINSFRVVFNQLFGAELPLLKDVSYFSTYNRPYDYSIVSNADCSAPRE